MPAKISVAARQLLRLLTFCVVIQAACVCSALGQSSKADKVVGLKQFVSNGNFDVWNKGIPENWQIDNGAGSGGEPFSGLTKGSDGGIEISGDRTTRTWKSLTQKILVESGGTYQINFQAKASGLKRESGQFDNCYLGVFSFNAAGKVISQVQVPVSSQQWSDEIAYFVAPQEATRTEIWIFLSKTGTLSIKQISINPSTKDSFEILVDDMDRNYSYFEHKKVDWKALTAKYRDQAKTQNPAKFVKVVEKMLAELRDTHVWLKHNGNAIHTFQKPNKTNFDLKGLVRQLKDVKVVRGFCLTGRTADGFGYVLIDSMVGINDQKFMEIANDIHRLLDSPGLIVDARVNSGGQELVGQKLAGMFCEKECVYAIRKIRSGEKHSDFTQGRKTILRPWRLHNGDKAYTNPIICLQGAGAVSSGEGFTLMMKALPHCTTLGQPTRGASGNPSPIKLPNGVEVWYSRWVAMDADGNPIEDAGVAPDVAFADEGKGSKIFDKAIEMLEQKIGQTANR